MKLSYSCIDASSALKQGYQPEDFLARTGHQTWYVADNDLMDIPVSWSIYKTGEHVRVPLFNYRSITADPACVLILAFELGATVQEYFQGEAEEIHISLSTPIQEVSDSEGSYFSFWLGVAIRYN
jgi:hypothetical protein